MEQKRKQLSLEQALNNGEKKASPMSKHPTQPLKIPRSLVEPVNKVTPFDKEKSEACHDLVKRLRQEKKARQKRIDEKQKVSDAKFQAEMEERRKLEEDKIW